MGPHSACGHPLPPVCTRMDTPPPTGLPPIHSTIGLVRCPAGDPEVPSWPFLFFPTEQKHGRVAPTAGRGRVIQGAWAKAAPQHCMMGCGRWEKKGDDKLQTCQPPNGLPAMR